MGIGMILAREVPKHLIKGVNNGTLKVYGSIIKDVHTGRIVGQLQEVSKVAKVAGQLVSSGINAGPVGLLTQVANFGVSVSTKVDTSEIKKTTHRIENKVDELTNITQQGFASVTNITQQGFVSMGKSLQGLTQLTSVLGIANLAVGIAGIGVSVVGFKKTLNAMNELQNNMNTRFDRIELGLNQIANDINQIAGDVKSIHKNQIRELHYKAKSLYNELRLSLETVIKTSVLDSGYNRIISETHSFLMQQIKQWLDNEDDTLDISTLLELNNVYTEFLRAYSFKYYCLNGEYIDFLETLVEPSRLLYSKNAMKILCKDILSSKEGNLNILNNVSSMYKYSIITPYTELYNTQEIITIKSSEELLELQEALSGISTEDGYALSLFN